MRVIRSASIGARLDTVELQRGSLCVDKAQLIDIAAIGICQVFGEQLGPLALGPAPLGVVLTHHPLVARIGRFERAQGAPTGQAKDLVAQGLALHIVRCGAKAVQVRLVGRCITAHAQQRADASTATETKHKHT